MHVVCVWVSFADNDCLVALFCELPCLGFDFCLDSVVSLVRLLALRCLFIYCGFPLCLCTTMGCHLR